MDEQPLVTVITATFNLCRCGRKETFRQCAESVQQQTYPNIEHLVIDGASDDGTLELIKEFAGNGRLKYISEPDKGLYDAMNKGLLAAKGKYVNILNSDDYFCDEEAVRLSVEALEKNGADLVYAPYYFLDDKGQKHLTPPDDILADFRMPSSHQTFFAKTAKVIDAGMYDLKYKICADYNNYLRMFARGIKLVKIDRPTACFRTGGISANQDQTRKEAIDILYNNYHDSKGFTLQDCSDICNNRLNKSLIKKINKPEVSAYFYRQQRKKLWKGIKRLPRFFMDIKWNHKQKYMRILGIYFINKKE